MKIRILLNDHQYNIAISDSSNNVNDEIAYHITKAMHMFHQNQSIESNRAIQYRKALLEILYKNLNTEVAAIAGKALEDNKCHVKTVGTGIAIQ